MTSFASTEQIAGGSRYLIAGLVWVAAAVFGFAGDPAYGQLLGRLEPLRLPLGVPDPVDEFPIHLIPGARRAEVEEIVRKSHFRQRSRPETFPCQPQVYLSVLNEPALTLALWNDLRTTTAQLQQIGDDLYQGDDGYGTAATWEFLARTPEHHILMGRLNHTLPQEVTRLDGRLLLLVRTTYLADPDGTPWIRHDVEAFVKVDTVGWRSLARVAAPLIEQVLIDQLAEAGLFVSVMGRLVESHPDWASQVAAQQDHVPAETRRIFREILEQTRRDDARPGRPDLSPDALGLAQRGMPSDRG